MHDDRDARALLGVWAHRPGDLTADERAAVEALLARDPAARAEADQLRGVIERVRALPPEGEPSWSALAASIRASCEAAPRSWWARVWPLPLVAGGLLAAAAVATV